MGKEILERLIAQAIKHKEEYRNLLLKAILTQQDIKTLEKTPKAKVRKNLIEDQIIKQMFMHYIKNNTREIKCK